MIQAYFFGERIISSSSLAFSTYEKSQLGEKNKNKIEYSGVEVLYLVGTGKMKVFFGRREITEESLLKKLKKTDKRIEIKEKVFSDLRRKGHIVKTALKFGADFRVYEKGIRMGEEHAKWILYCVKESEQIKWNEFVAKGRIAHSTKKNLLLGVVDDEGSVIYYEAGWIKP